MSDVIDVNDNTFDSEVVNSKLPVLVDFGAAWCGPCQRQNPIVEIFAKDNTNKIKVVKIDIDDAPVVTAKFGIRSVPTLMMFNVGVPVGSKVGLSSLAEINNFIVDKLTTTG